MLDDDIPHVPSVDNNIGGGDNEETLKLNFSVLN